MAGTLTDPIQSFSITEDVQFHENGKAKLYLFNISVSAKIVASQTLSIENKKAFILARQTAIMNQFKDYSNASAKYFEVQPRDGTSPFKFLPRVKSINFKEDVWVDFCDYTIEMEADEIHIGKADGTSLKVPSSTVNPSDIDESWSTEYNQEDLRLTKVVHKISAKSKSVGALKGWKISKDAVLLKIDALIPTDIQTASGTTYDTPCNKLISYNVNPNSGEFSAEVNIVYHNPTIFYSVLEQDAYAYHEQTATDKSTTESLRESLSIEGTITGLNATSNGNRFTAANDLWTTVKGALDQKYQLLTVTSFSETKDLEKGIITYNYEIENIKRPIGFKSESISVTLFNPKAESLKNYVIHNTIYGTSGPIFQDIKTKKVRTMSVTIERIGTEATPDTLTGYQPAGSVIESDSINFTAQNKKISRTTTFMWADDSIQDFPTAPAVNFAVLKTAIPRP
jgi:hypothetical protein